MAVSSMRSRSKISPKPFSYFTNIDFKTFRKDLKIILTNPDYSWVVGLFLLLLEIFVTTFVIIKVPYTEIDWKAYMQEVEGVVNGTLDYKLLKGDTGPLVYPAGFVYIYLLLYFITLQGTSIIVAQCIFAFLYLATLYVVFRLYIRSNVVPPYALIFMCCTSYRIHSIYVLRLFNDPVAVFFLFCALNYFCENRWFMGSIFFSFAVSIKMNILLFAPGLFFVMLYSIGIYQTLRCILLCGAIQVALGLPFLITHPLNYITGAFDFGRVFLHEWTVNWRFVPEDIFISRGFHISLLLFHLAFLAIFAVMCVRNYGLGVSVTKDEVNPLSVDNILFIMFMSNFIGVVFSRSLHYQFYVWYFFTLPHLLWSTTYNPVLKLCVLGILELCWNTYPSTVFSSSMLHMCHFMILCNIMYRGLTFKKPKVQ